MSIFFTYGGLCLEICEHKRAGVRLTSIYCVHNIAKTITYEQSTGRFFAAIDQSVALSVWLGTSAHLPERVRRRFGRFFGNSQHC